MGGSQRDLELADEWQQADEAEVDVGFERRERALAMADHGLRLDKLLTLLAPEFSRNHLQGLVEPW